MYKIFVDGSLICSSALDEIALIDPVVELEVNCCGSFTFTFPSDHAHKDSINERKSKIDVYQDGDLIFEGVATEISDDMYGQRTITCEGELTFLNDSIQRQHAYTDVSVGLYLDNVIAYHNSQVEESKKFYVGSVTVDGSVTAFTNYETTMKELGEDLIDKFGGYFRIRHSMGRRYIDYLAESPHTSNQTIALGKNILDLKSNISNLDICTVLIPLGAKLEEQVVPGLDARLTIESVNSGLDYLENAAAITEFGRITKINTWDDVTSANTLKTKGRNFLSSQQYSNLVVNVTAFDLGLATDVFDQFRLLDTIRVISEPHGLDRNMMVTKMTLNLSNPESNTITLGFEESKTISAKTALATSYGDAIDAKIDHSYSRAVQTATSLIASAMGGYVYKTTSELYIMDTNDPQTATKVWRWNLNGLGYSSSGIDGPYGLAMTMNGSIVADYITTGIIRSFDERFKVDLDAGTADLANVNITGGSINMVTDYNTVKLTLDSTNRKTTQSPLEIDLLRKDTPQDNSISANSIIMKGTNTAGTGLSTNSFAYMSCMGSGGNIKVGSNSDDDVSMSYDNGFSCYDSASNHSTGGILKTKTMSGTTSASGNLNLSLGNKCLILGIWETGTSNTRIVIPYKGSSATASELWWAHVISDASTYTVIASKTVKLKIIYWESTTVV